MAARQRGLILQKKHAYKFFEASAPKTLELRNHNLRCVAPHEHFWIVECGHGRNGKGSLVYRVLGRVTFVENVALTAASVANMYSHHLCNDQDFKELQSKWKKPDNIIGWRVADAHEFRPSRWLRPSSNEGWLHFRLEDLYTDFEMSDCDRGDATILSQLHPILQERSQPAMSTFFQNCARRPVPSVEVAEVAGVAAIAGAIATDQEEEPQQPPSTTALGSSWASSAVPHGIRVIDVTDIEEPVESRGAYSPVPEATAENIAEMLNEIDDALRVEPRRATDAHETNTETEETVTRTVTTGTSTTSRSLGTTRVAEARGEDGSGAMRPQDSPDKTAEATSPTELDPETELFYITELAAQLEDVPTSHAATGAENTSGCAPTASTTSQTKTPSASSTTVGSGRHSRPSTGPTGPSTDTRSTPDVWKTIRDVRYGIQRKAGRALR